MNMLYEWTPSGRREVEVTEHWQPIWDLLSRVDVHSVVLNNDYGISWCRYTKKRDRRVSS